MENYTLKLLKMEETEKEIILRISLRRAEQSCAACGTATNQIHDYRVRRIRDLKLRGKASCIEYRQRRYACPNCGKRFSQRCAFARKYQRFSHRAAEKVAGMLSTRTSMKQIARESGTSVSGVSRILNVLSAEKPKALPEAISFDEFRGTAGGERFQCIVTDPKNRRVLDILPSRKVETIQDYLRSYSNRDEVKYVVMDMNRGFRDVARAFFPGAKIIIDCFRVVRLCTETMDNVRREFQKKLPGNQRRYFKHSRRLLLAHRERLNEADRAAVDVMLRFDERLRRAYALKESFYQFMASVDRKEADHRLDSWPDTCDRLKIPPFQPVRKMLLNWRPYILNAFVIHLSNGFTEGCNNAIKTLKRVCFGFRNFSSFRKRIRLSFYPHPYI